MTAFDLGNVGVIVDRPGATPAPTLGNPDTGPGNGQRPGPSMVEVKGCGCITGDLCTHVCDDTRDRIELTLAPAVLLQMAPPTRWSCTGGTWTAVA